MKVLVVASGIAPESGGPTRSCKGLCRSLSQEGVDVALIGPNDMSQDYGILGQFDNPIIINAINRVIKAAKDNGKYSGAHFGAVPKLMPWLHSGMTMNMCNSDSGLLMKGAQELKTLREEIAK